MRFLSAVIMIVSVIVLSLLIAGFFVPWRVVAINPNPQVNFIGGSSVEIKLYFVGDIMLDRGVEFYGKKQGNGEWGFPFEKIKDELSRADFVFGNLKGPVSDKGKRVGSIYSFGIDQRLWQLSNTAIRPQHFKKNLLVPRLKLNQFFQPELPHGL